MDTDRNLLLGVLALRAQLIDDFQFADACATWARRRELPLAEVLASRGWLTAGDRAALERRLEQLLGQPAGDLSSHDPTVVRADAPCREPCPKDLESWGSSADTSTPTDGQELPPPVEYVPAVRSRYALLRLHGSGGIGQVWLARDDYLGRDVALKELRPEKALSPEHRTRFLEEARITARLEHPGVVPVYELVRHPGTQQPFYTMRFVNGRTLREAAEAHQQKQAAGQAGPLDLRGLLNAFVAVCNVVAYAHAHGVIHRDLKGENIILGDFGEVLVLDWGLAKVMGQAETTTSLGPVAPSPDGALADTETGEVRGTPAYMAPEQAAGRQDLIGSLTDVYGLGAILYEVLTGRPPFTGAKSLNELLRRVREEKPVRPQQVSIGVPPALEAVCLQALAKQPAGRYASARDLADEVQRWLADEPVRAYPETLWVRTQRWVKRRRVLVTSAAAAVLVALLSLGVGTALLSAANAELHKANQSEAEARRKASERFLQARKAVDDFYTDVSDNPRLLRKAPGTQKLRQELLRRAKDYYEGFLKEQGDEPELRRATAMAYSRLASITLMLSPGPKAVDLGLQALDLLARLTEDHPENPDYAYDLAGAHVRLGYLFRTVGQPEEALRAFEQARDLFDRLAQTHPDLSTGAVERARTHSHLGNAYRAAGRVAEARRSFQQALDLWKQLLQNQPTSPEYTSGMAATYQSFGLLYLATHQPAEAISVHEVARDLWLQVVRDHDDVPDYSHGLVDTCVNLGNTYMATGKDDLALRAYQQAHDVQQKLVRDNPDVPDYVESLAATYSSLANLHYTCGRRVEALQGFEQARLLYEKLVQDHADVPDYRFGLGGSYCNLGNVLTDSGKPEAALTWYTKAVRELEDLDPRKGRIMMLAPYLSNSHAGRAIALAKLNRHAEALADWDKALALADGSRRDWLRRDRAFALVRANQVTTAVAEAEALAARGGKMGSFLYDAARIYALAAAATVSKGQPPTPEQQRLVEQYAARAVVLLRQAETAGYFQDPAAVENMKRDGDLEALHGRDDYSRLVDDLTRK
jgi:serine/threonine-protein kinase